MIKLTGAIYARRSASRDNLSTDNQVERCQAYAPRVEAHLARQRGRDVQIHIPENRILTDKGESGQDFDRAAYYRLRDVISAGEINVLLIYDIDRLGRTEDITDMFLERRFCIQHGVSVWAEVEDLEVTATDDVALFRFFIGGWRAHKELEDIRRRTKQGRWAHWRHDRERAAFGGRLRYGLALDDDKHFVPDPDQAATVGRMFAWLVGEGLGGEQIARRLTRLDVPTPSGKGRWWAQTVRRILNNALLYAGAGFEYHVQDDDGETHTITVPTPEIIGLEIAQAALRILDKQSKPKLNKNLYLLSGLLKCGLCGRHFTGHGNGQYTYYKCTGRSKPETLPCQMAIIPRDALDGPMWGDVARVVSDPRILTDALGDGGNADRVAASIGEIERQIDAQRKAQARLAMSWAQARIPNDVLESSLAETRQRIDELETELRQLEWQRLVLASKETDLLADIQTINLDNLPPNARAAIIQRMVSHIEVVPSGWRSVEATIYYYRLDAVLSPGGQNSRDLYLWTIPTSPIRVGY